MIQQRERRFCDTEPDRAKVYCKDCVFFRWADEGHQRRAECGHPHAQQGSTDWYGTRVGPEVRNAGQDCSDFRRETWVEELGEMALPLGGLFMITAIILLMLYFLR